MKSLLTLLFLLLLMGFRSDARTIRLNRLKSPVLFLGNEHTAYRDPAVLYQNGKFFLFMTLVEIEPDGFIYMYIAATKSKDLMHWSPLTKLTPRDQNLNYSSPGNVIRFHDEWLLCIQTYPRPGYTIKQMPGYGNKDARLFILRSKDLENWSEPELLKVKGPDVAVDDMGRMIDPYLLEDKDEPGKYWCFFKQNGVSMSYTRDFINWTYSGHTESGENVCVLTDNNDYILFHSPPNGIGIKRSKDLKTWYNWGDLITLGQAGWPWAKGRITAGAVIRLSNNPKARYLMFFHGSGPLKETEGDFDKNASVGMAWSNDLINWEWPGCKK